MTHQVSAPQVDAELNSYADALLQTDKEPSKYPVRRPECPRDASRWGNHFSFFVGNFCEFWTRGDRMYCCAAPLVTQVPNPCAACHRRGLKFELASYELQGFQRSQP